MSDFLTLFLHFFKCHDALVDPGFESNQSDHFLQPFQADEVADGEAAVPLERSEGQTAVLVPPHRVSLMWTAWVFFKSFFSSLIPEGPRGMAN